MLYKKPLTAIILATSILATGACMHMDKKPANDDQTRDYHEDKGVVPMAEIDSDMKSVLDAQDDLGAKPIEILSPAEARKQPTVADGAMKVLKDAGRDPMPTLGVTTRDITIDGYPARIYTPEDANSSMPVVVYYHGGGFVLADIKTYDASARSTAKGANAIVVSVEYPHAPEHKFPAAWDHAFNAYKWVVQNAASFGGNPRQVAVMGESAGGNLAINTSIKARDTGFQLPVYEVLVYPVAGVDMKTKSYQENAFAKPLNLPMMKWFMKYTTNSKADLNDPRLDLVGKADLHGLPPTTIILAQIDPLRSEGHKLAKKLEEANVPTSAKVYSGVTHEFYGTGLVTSGGAEAEARVAQELKAAFNE